MIGIPASPGIAIGRAHKVIETSEEVQKYKCGLVTEELVNLEKAVAVSTAAIKEIKKIKHKKTSVKRKHRYLSHT